MAKRSKKPRPVSWVVASHKPLPEPAPWHEALDQAVERQFPNVRAVTGPTTRGFNTHITMRDSNERLMPRQHRVISAFIAGFMACERSY